MNPTLLELTSPKLAELEALLAKEKIRRERPRRPVKQQDKDGRIRRINRAVPIEELHDWFWSMATKSDNGCWEWNGILNDRGYGVVSYGATIRHKAHRVAAYFLIGKWPEKFVCHSCDNPKCINPSHLFLGTQKDNAQDMTRKGRNAVQYGEVSHFCKLTTEQAVFIKTSPEDPAQLAKRFGIHKTHLLRIRNGRSWKHLNYE